MADRTDLVVEARFECDECGKECGHIQLFGSAASAQVQRASFTSQLAVGVGEDEFDLVRLAIETQDAGFLHSIDLEYVPFYCPQCEACYCGDHWITMEVFDDDVPYWHDSTRGVCPKGHQRMLED